MSQASYQLLYRRPFTFANICATVKRMIRTFYQTPTFNPDGNRIVADFVSRLCFGHPDGFDRYSTMGVVEDGRLIGGTVYHNWQPEAGVMELSSAANSRRWLQPHVIRAMMALPFDMMGAQMIVLRVSERNAGMIRIARRFGFTGHLIPRLRGRDEAEWVFCLTDDDWRAHPLALRGERR